MKYKKNLSIFILIIIMIGGFIVRFYRFNNPIADWHSWRQADTAAVTRNFVKQGFTPLYPKFDAENSLNERQLPNPNRYFFAEFPIYNILVYAGFTSFGHFTIEQWGRLISIFFSTLSIGFLYLLVRKYSSERIALISSFVFAFLPYNIYYGRVIMPDPMHICFSVLSLYLVTLWVRLGKWYLALLSGLAFTIAVLTKPYALVLLLPIAYLMLSKWRLRIYKIPSVYLFTVVGIVPFILWRRHINMFPEGQFGTTWLFNQGNIRFTGAFFRWLIYDRMNRLIFATGGFVLFWLGVIKAETEKEGFFYYTWFLSVLIFFTVIARGNVTHDYYQMPIVPIGSIFVAIGFDYLISNGNKFHQRAINTGIALILMVLMFSFGWYEVRGYFNINHPEIVEAGIAADKLLPKDARVITPYDNDSAFLYQTNRHGWTFGGDKIPKWISEGAQYLVSVNYDDITNIYIKNCVVVTKTPSYAIINLTKCKTADKFPVAVKS